MKIDMKIDMWYGNTVKEADKIDIIFYPNNCEYRGNIYKNGKCIGDYVCKNSLEIEKAFNHMQVEWN